MICHLLLDEDDLVMQIVHYRPESSHFLLALCGESLSHISDFPFEGLNLSIPLSHFGPCLVRFRIRRDMERVRLLIGKFEVLAQIISVSESAHATSFRREGGQLANGALKGGKKQPHLWELAYRSETDVRRQSRHLYVVPRVPT